MVLGCPTIAARNARDVAQSARILWDMYVSLCTCFSECYSMAHGVSGPEVSQQVSMLSTMSPSLYTTLLSVSRHFPNIRSLMLHGRVFSPPQPTDYLVIFQVTDDSNYSYVKALESRLQGMEKLMNRVWLSIVTYVPSNFVRCSSSSVPT